MKRIITIVLACTVLALAGCAGDTTPEATSAPPATTGAETPVATTEPATTEPVTTEPASEEPTEAPSAAPNEDGIAVTAAVLERMAILPGSLFRVHVTVANSGTETVHYQKGSGSYTVPDAVALTMEGLQVLPTRDRLGVATMDMQTGELAPGESLNYDFFVLAAEPNEEIVAAVRELFTSENVYVGDLNAEELKEKLPSIVNAQPGSYEGLAEFAYYKVAEGGNAIPTEDTEIITVTGAFAVGIS